jgi:signal peptidase I
MDAMLSFTFPFWRAGNTAMFLGATGVLVVQPYRPLVVVGDSMTPTYHTGDIAWTVPTDGPLHRGEVVVIEMPSGPIVKRVAFVEGDRYYQLRAKSGESVDLVEWGSSRPPGANRQRLFERTLGHDLVYVLGDNRAGSLDSRSFGPVPREWVTRRVVSPRPLPKPSPFRLDPPQLPSAG